MQPEENSEGADAAPPHQQFRDPTRRMRWTRALLIASILTAFAGILSDILEYNLLVAIRDGAHVSDAQITANDTRTTIVWSVYFVVALASFAAMLIWIYRANKNARALGAVWMSHSPGWSVGWFFVPVMNLGKPYSVVAEIWDASAALDQSKADRCAPGFILVWWLATVIAWIGGRVEARLIGNANTLEDFILTSWLSLGLAPVNILASAMFLLILRGVHEVQTARAPQTPAA